MASGPNSAAMDCEAGGDGVEGFVPGDALEAAFALGADAALGIEQAVGGVFALQVLRHFAAEEAAGDGVGRVAAQFGAVAVFDGDQEGAGVRTIERAHGMADFGHGEIIASGGGRVQRRESGPDQLEYK